MCMSYAKQASKYGVSVQFLLDLEHKQNGCCAICGKPQNPKNKPFCSPRCADIDLGRWLKGSYAIPAVDDDDDEDGMSSSDEG